MKLLLRTAVLMIRGYQACSRLFPAHCRFSPSCSAFMAESLERHGLGKGLVLGLGRLLRCHPWHAGGSDPVPLSGAAGVGTASPGAASGAPTFHPSSFILHPSRAATGGPPLRHPSSFILHPSSGDR